MKRRFKPADQGKALPHPYFEYSWFPRPSDKSNHHGTNLNNQPQFDPKMKNQWNPIILQKETAKMPQVPTVS